jgi:hypothetical protein
MAGQYRFKDSCGNIVAQISASADGTISFSGSTANFSQINSINLGSTTITGTADNANTLNGYSASAFVFTSSFNPFSSSVSSQLVSLESVTASYAISSSVASIDSIQNNRLSSIETISASNLNRIGSLETISASNISRIDSLETVSASNISRLSSLEEKTGSLATTGSNIYKSDQIITGSLYISQNLVVQGSSSIQYISQSTLNIGTNLITVNSLNPSSRFAGLAVIDSGSTPQVSGSLLFDSIDDEWIFVHQIVSGAALTSSIMITGPETYNNLGNETRLSTNIIPKVQSGFHIVDSCIVDNGTTVCVNATLKASGQVCGVMSNFSCGGIGTITPSNGKFEVQQTACSPGLWIQTGGTTTSYCIASFRTGTNLAALEIYGNGTSVFGNNICANVNSNTFGTAAASGRALIVQAGSGNQAIQFKNCWGGDGTIYACGNATAFHYVFNTYSCSDVVFIANGGNVGFGCNNPGYTIDVNGNAHFSSVGGTMLIESTQPTNQSTLKIIQCSTGGNGNTDQGLVVQTNAGDGTSNIANFYDYNNGSAISRVRFLRNGITCFQNTICVAGQVSSEDVRIYRSAGTTTGYINFGSTGTNYFGWDGGKFSANGCIAATASIFSNTVVTSCKILVNGTSAAWGGIPGYEINTSLEAILGFKKNGSAAGYVYHNGTNMYLSNELSGVSGCVVFNNNAGIAGAFDPSNNLCIAGNIKAANGLFNGSVCGSGIKLGTGSYNTGYTPDGLYGGTATPNYISSPTGGQLRLGYTDNGSGLYGTAYGFDVSYRDGLNNPIDYNAIIMRNAGQGTTPFRVTSYGNIYGNTKNFRIKHPIPSMNDTHYLIHTSIEGPQADLIYRGKVQLVNGKAEVNIDTASRMTDGTFELLCQDIQSYTTNETGWALTKSYVVGNILHIEAQDETADDIISWLVIAERNDDGIKNSALTDENGHVIVEELKPEEGT